MHAGVTCAQDLLYVVQALHFLELKVKLPMLLEMDDKEEIDLINVRSVGG